MSSNSFSRNDIVVFALGGLTALATAAAYRHITRSTTIITTSAATKAVKIFSDWIVGTNQPKPFNSNKYKCLDPKELQASATYFLLISAVVPRPIALVRFHRILSIYYLTIIASSTNSNYYLAISSY